MSEKVGRIRVDGDCARFAQHGCGFRPETQSLRLQCRIWCRRLSRPQVKFTNKRQKCRARLTIASPRDISINERRSAAVILKQPMRCYRAAGKVTPARTWRFLSEQLGPVVIQLPKLLISAGVRNSGKYWSEPPIWAHNFSRGKVSEPAECPVQASTCSSLESPGCRQCRI